VHENDDVKYLAGLTLAILSAVWVLVEPAIPQVHSVPEQSPAEAGTWAMERVILLDGRELSGLVGSQDEFWVYLTEIRRPVGRPMYLVVRPIERTSIARLVRLKPEERAKLRGRIEQFRHRARIEAGKMEAVRLGLVEIDGTHYRPYRGRWFSLDSSADERITRRVIVRVEQIFAAYRQILPPRIEARRPLRLVILGALDEYDAYLERLGLKINNRAVFVERENLVVAGSELARFAALLAKINARHDQLRDELKQLQRSLPERLHEISEQLRKQGKTRNEIITVLLRVKRETDEEIKGKRNEIRRCDRQNEQAFDQVTRQMFTRLYHEAFHAYLENYVFPHENNHVPHWLNEGLATMFEAGLLESGALRVDAPNRPALKKLKSDLKGGQPLALTELLAADQQSFLVAHDTSSEQSNRHYSYAWGLVYYLTFEKDLLDSPALLRYVAPDAKTIPPVARFEGLVGMPLAQFEKAWREYIATLP